MPDIETENDAREAVALALNRINATAAGLVEIKAKLTAAATRVGGFVVKAAEGEEVAEAEWDTAEADCRRLSALASRQLAVLAVQKTQFLSLLARAA